jgi:hypothetical protein
VGPKCRSHFADEGCLSPSSPGDSTIKNDEDILCQQAICHPRAAGAHEKPDRWRISHTENDTSNGYGRSNYLTTSQEYFEISDNREKRKENRAKES